LLPLSKLLPDHEYPKDVPAFYAQAYSLTDFLVAAFGRRTFLAFVRQGEEFGWDWAAQHHYNCATVAEVERAWLERVRADAGPSHPNAADAPPQDAAALRQGIRLRSGEGSATDVLPASPPPAQALVALDKDGRLRVKTAIHYYEPKTTVNAGGTPVTTYRQVATLHEVRYRLKEVHVYDVKGKAVDKKTLAKLLPKETLALVAVQGMPADPLHLRLVKEGTLLFVLPVPVAPPAPPILPAVGVPPSEPQPARPLPREAWQAEPPTPVQAPPVEPPSPRP
jgi:hypothetical protein